MAELLSEYPDALENTIMIAEQCNVMLELDKQNLPKYPAAGGISADELLEEACWQGFADRYPDGDDEHKNRLRYELNIIRNMKFSDYFLIVWDFMKFSRKMAF